MFKRRRQFDSTEQAVVKGNPRALYQVDTFWAPCYCPDCDRSYCAKHWSVTEVYDDKDSVVSWSIRWFGSTGWPTI